MKFISSLLLLLNPVALALPASLGTEVESLIGAAIEARKCYVQCGSTCYTSSQVSAARSAGYKIYYQNQKNRATSRSNYPHAYNNHEGFPFLVDGPYQEFPLQASGAYTKGFPGADRVVFNTAGQLAGEITHSGASRNKFVACSGW